MTSSTGNAIQMPKPIIIGAGVLILLGLFLASGDPGKKEREQLRQALTEVQAKINALEAAQAEQQAQLKSQQEHNQLLLRRLEISEENQVRLRARLDETERQLAAQRKAATASAVKPPAAKPTMSTKPTSNTKTTTPTKKP